MTNHNTTFQVYYINHGYYACRNFDTVSEALAYARTVGFQASIMTTDKRVVASWCPLYGHKYYTLDNVA